jgi:hydroxyethylthiazole kinase-like uncharacterized protein yjeF
VIAGYSAAQVRAAEAPHLAAGEPLMRRAATALAVVLRRVLRETDAQAGPVVLLVGSGDNGGDALYAGAELANEGVEVIAIRTADRVHEEAAAAARDAGAMVVSREDPDAGAALTRSAVVVDGILGTGTTNSPALRGGARDVVAAALAVIRERGIPVVAVDLPSGVHPDDGSVPDPTVLPATVTVTFGAVKAGLLRVPGSRYAGRVELVDLGLGAELAEMTPLIVSD